MVETLKHLSHSVGQNSFHLVWKPKWARRVFENREVRLLCDSAIRHAARKNGMQLIELEVMPDHVHCFVNLPPTMSVSIALQRLKGYSAHLLLKHTPWLRNQFPTGHLWSPGKFFSSIDNTTIDAVKHYIAESNRGARTQQLLTRYPAL